MALYAAKVDAERKQAEEALRKEKQLSESIIENTPAGIAFLDNDFVLRKCNRVYADLIRTYSPYTPEQVLGMSYYDYAPGSRPQVEEWFKKVRDFSQTETRYGFELTLKSEGSELKTYWDTSIAPVLDQSGRVEGILILTQDVTERKRGEEALRKSEEKYRTIIENIEEGYYEVDLAGNYTFLDHLRFSWSKQRESAVKSKSMDIRYLHGYRFVSKDKPYPKEACDVRTEYSTIFSLSSNQNCRTNGYSRGDRSSHQGRTRQTLSTNMPEMRPIGFRSPQLDSAQDSRSQLCYGTDLDHLPISKTILCSLPWHPH